MASRFNLASRRDKKSLEAGAKLQQMELERHSKWGKRRKLLGMETCTPPLRVIILDLEFSLLMIFFVNFFSHPHTHTTNGLLLLVTVLPMLRS
jgi:hypothetical protein